MKQHDDHIWLVANGKSWAIHHKRGDLLFLWRGYEPDIECAVLDVSCVDWKLYCEKAVEMLQEEERSEIIRQAFA